MADGFGVPPEGWDASVYARHCPAAFVRALRESSVPLDTTMDMPGLPQSATGQTAIFTGLNAARLRGGHLQGFPGPVLREAIRGRNLFKALLEAGKSVTFANAYVRHSLEELSKDRHFSVTSVMVDSTLGTSRGLAELRSGEAVFCDLTRGTISAEYQVPEISPEAAAAHLAALSASYDLTLFEYFLTDRAGHRTPGVALDKVLDEFGRFMAELLRVLPAATALLLCSDHGNVEDPEVVGHTYNPTPLLVKGRAMPAEGELRSLMDIFAFAVETVVGEAVHV